MHIFPPGTFATPRSFNGDKNLIRNTLSGDSLKNQCQIERSFQFYYYQLLAAYRRQIAIHHFSPNTISTVFKKSTYGKIKIGFFLH